MKKLLLFFLLYMIIPKIFSNTAPYISQTYQNNTVLIDCRSTKICNVLTQHNQGAVTSYTMPFTTTVSLRWLSDGHALITTNIPSLNEIMITFPQSKIDTFNMPIIGFNNDETAFLEMDVHSQYVFLCAMQSQNCYFIQDLAHYNVADGNITYFFNKNEELIVINQKANFCHLYQFNYTWLNKSTQKPEIRGIGPTALDTMSSPCFNPYAQD